MKTSNSSGIISRAAAGCMQRHRRAERLQCRLLVRNNGTQRYRRRNRDRRTGHGRQHHPHPGAARHSQLSALFQGAAALRESDRPRYGARFQRLDRDRPRTRGRERKRTRPRRKRKLHLPGAQILRTGAQRDAAGIHVQNRLYRHQQRRGDIPAGNLRRSARGKHRGRPADGH